MLSVPRYKVIISRLGSDASRSETNSVLSRYLDRSLPCNCCVNCFLFSVIIHCSGCSIRFLNKVSPIVNMSFSFERQKVLGKGNFGVVFEGNWNGQRVAVKRINLMDLETRRNGEESPEEVLKNLDHLNVIKLFHVDSDMDFK